jgi:hypothetical protein
MGLLDAQALLFLHGSLLVLHGDSPIALLRWVYRWHSEATLPSTVLVGLTEGHVVLMQDDNWWLSDACWHKATYAAIRTKRGVD